MADLNITSITPAGCQLGRSKPFLSTVPIGTWMLSNGAGTSGSYEIGTQANALSRGRWSKGLALANNQNGGEVYNNGQLVVTSTPAIVPGEQYVLSNATPGALAPLSDLSPGDVSQHVGYGTAAAGGFHLLQSTVPQTLQTGAGGALSVELTGVPTDFATLAECQDSITAGDLVFVGYQSVAPTRFLFKRNATQAPPSGDGTPVIAMADGAVGEVIPAVGYAVFQDLAGNIGDGNVYVMGAADNEVVPMGTLTTGQYVYPAGIGYSGGFWPRSVINRADFGMQIP